MSKRAGQMKLGAFLYPTGHHIAAWRHPQAQADAGSNFAHYAELARTAEAAKFDLIFMADGVGTRGTDTEALSRTAIRYVAQFEPLTLLSALAALTDRVGFVATASTTYNEPYHIARKFASLDHISGGRAGWNLVTSASEDEAHNFNREHHVAHAERYERAEEFADVVRGLWDTLGRGRLPSRQGERHLLRPRQATFAQSPRQAFQGPRAAQCRARAAGPSGNRSGRLIGAGQGSGRPHRGSHLYRAPEYRGCPRLL